MCQLRGGIAHFRVAFPQPWSCGGRLNGAEELHHRPNQVAVDGAQLAEHADLRQKDHRMKAYIRFHQRK